MKRTLFSLVLILFVSMAYGQAIEMSTVLPTAPVAVVDELRVIGTGNTNVSTISTVNLGIVSNGQNTMPFQKQILDVDGDITSVEVLSAGRSLFYTGAITGLNSLSVYKDGTAFADVSAITSASAGLFRAAVVESASTNTLNVGDSISAKSIEIDDMVMESPFARGTFIDVKNKTIAQNLSDTDKYHIYYPWKNNNSDVSTLSKCNSDNSLCSKTQCDTCNSGTSSTLCYDSRTKTISDYYDAKGATYEKIGSVKFYCKPVEIFDSEGDDATHTWDADASGCKQYMVSSINGVLSQGFTSAVGDAEAVAYPLSSTTTNNTAVETALTATRDIGHICNILCNNGNTGCASDTTFLRAVSEGNTVEDVNGLFNDDDYCENASWGQGEGWPLGSGLTCKVTEKVIDVYAIFCPQYSGAKQVGGTITQYRKVACKQYSNVSAELSDISDTQKDEILNKAYFYPEFEN